MSVAFSPDGQWLACAGKDKVVVRKWPLTEGEQPLNLGTLGGGGGRFLGVAVSPNGSLLAAANEDGLVYLWDMPNCRARDPLIGGYEKGVLALAFSPDGKWLASGSAGTETDMRVIIWDLATRTIHANLVGHTGQVTCIAFSPDGPWPGRRRVVTGSNDGTVKVWDPESGMELLSLKDGRRVYSVAFSPDGRLLVSAGEGPVRIRQAWDRGEQPRE